MADKSTHDEIHGTGGGSETSLIKAAWLQATSCQAVFKALEAGGFDGRAVGGSVRNSLMGIEVSDVDIATPALPDEVTEVCQAAGLSVHPTGLAHGTVTVVSGHVPYEVTTLRQDVETHGRHATVAFTRDWRADASRRDFTMNALYCDRHGVVDDPLGGLADLFARRVRFIGSARGRIREDYLRILRFFRFFATYGEGPIDADGLTAAASERDGLSGLSAERIRVELLKLLTAPRAHEALFLMTENGIAQLVLGRDPELDRFEKLTILETLMGVGPDPILRLAAVAACDVSSALELAGRLKLSNAECKELICISGSSTEQFVADPKDKKAWLYRLGETAYRDVCLSAWSRSPDDVNNANWRSAFTLPDRWQAPTMPFKGGDIVSLGVPAGPAVGDVLLKFERWWIEADFPEDRKLLQTKLMQFANH